MITRTDLTKTARAHLRDASILYRRGSYDGAVYLCGYAVGSHSKPVFAALSDG